MEVCQEKLDQRQIRKGISHRQSQELAFMLALGLHIVDLTRTWGSFAKMSRPADKSLELRNLWEVLKMFVLSQT